MNGLYVDPHVSDATNYGWLAIRATKILLPVALTTATMPAPARVLSMLCCTCSTDVVTESVHVVDPWNGVQHFFATAPSCLQQTVKTQRTVTPEQTVGPMKKKRKMTMMNSMNNTD